MRAPCDELVIRCGSSGAPSVAKSGPWILAATILGSSMAFIDSTIVNVAAPKFQSAFHASIVDVQWVIESYGLFLSALILAGGALGDRLGRRLMFLLGVGIFAVASGCCGLAPNIQVLVIARSVQGIGAALLVPGSLAIISASFDEKSRGPAIGTWSGFTAITTALGPVLGGALIEYGSWRWAFFLNVPLAAAVIAISLRHVPESRSSSAMHLDWPGAVLATASLGGVVTGFLESSQFGWRSSMVIASLFGGLICLVLFLWIESRVSSPMVSFALFRSRSFPRRESFDTASLFCDWHFLLPVSGDLDASIWIFGHGRRSSDPADHLSNVFLVALVRRTGRKVRGKSAADCRDRVGSRRFCSIRSAVLRRDLLDDLLSRVAGTWFGICSHRRTANHRGNGLRRSRPCRRSVGNQQCCGPIGGSAGHRHAWNRYG